jgi:(E)-4-hydroxy-3-methylbut-2-enyl-diphosphate synthase
VAVPSQAAADAIAQIKKQIAIPLIADIHFDHRLAIASARSGADGLRFNPGNIGSRKNIQDLVACAKGCRIPIRIGVNAGSLEKDILEKHQGVTPAGMVESALRHVALLQDLDFNDIKISIKASDVPRTLEAYRLMSQHTDLPLHVGVTEAGSLYAGIVKSALGIGSLLADGIGDTLRVSLTRDPVEEVRVGFEILRALDIRHHGPEIIACPTCGRCDIPLFDIVDRVEKALMTCSTPVKLAIMGCVVNGPGEAREADIGVAGGSGVGILFKKGKVVKKFPQNRLVEVVLEAVAAFEKEHRTK